MNVVGGPENSNGSSATALRERICVVFLDISWLLLLSHFSEVLSPTKQPNSGNICSSMIHLLVASGKSISIAYVSTSLPNLLLFPDLTIRAVLGMKPTQVDICFSGAYF